MAKLLLEIKVHGLHGYLEDVDLVGITCYTMTAPRVYEIADEFRRRGKTVVLGGYHPTAMPEEAKQHADSVVMGMAEASWPRLLEDFEKGKLKPFYEKDYNFDLSNAPPLRRDLINRNPLMGAVQWTRGCANRCEFCAISSFYEHGVLRRPIKAVVEEIKHCLEWFIGFESVSQKSLESVKKTHNKVENFRKLIQRLHKFGMAVQGGIIFGFDEDTPDIFDLTLEKMYEWELDVAEINILTPYPGTPLFDRLKREGRILTYDWSKYNQVEVVYKPKNMTEKELYEGARKVAKNFYSIPFLEIDGGLDW